MSIGSIADINTQIATATEQQTATMHEIDRNVTSIHQAHEKTLGLGVHLALGATITRGGGGDRFTGAPFTYLRGNKR